MANSATRLERLVPILRSEPDNLPLHRECVELAMTGGEYSCALELVEARLTRHPTEAETMFARSNALIGLKRYAEALEILKLLEEQRASPLAVLKNIATCHYFLQQFENARVCAERLIAGGEADAATLYYAISSLHHLGALDAAVELADAHAAAAEKNVPLAGACAMAFLDEQLIEKAGKFAAIALAGNPDSIDGLTVQATLAASELQSGQALRQFSRIVELAPQSGRAWLGLGTLAILAMDFGKARERLERATELMPKHLGCWHALAWAHLFSGDLAGAEEIFAHVLEIDRNFAESHGAIAAMHAMKGEREAAEREIEIAERLDRGGMSSHFARAVLIAGASGPEAAGEFIRTTVRALAPRFGGKPGIVFSGLAAGNSKGPRPR